MKNPAQPSDRIPVLAALCLGAILGAGLGAAVAQDRPPGQLDSGCMQDCAAQGYDSEFCNKLCWVPAPTQARTDETTDWICMTDCSDRGGRYLDCKQRCKLR